jgi:hypothetical protein
MAAGLTTMPPTSVITRLILIMVWRKLIHNPNTYSRPIGCHVIARLLQVRTLLLIKQISNTTTRTHNDHESN